MTEKSETGETKTVSKLWPVSSRRQDLRSWSPKAAAVAARHAGALVLGADTVVACGRRILPKPDHRDLARQCLTLLSGRSHRVYGGIALVTPSGAMLRRTILTAVTFKRLSALEIDAYLDGGEWRDKAGAYAIQGHAAAFVRRINGSYSNVVGLPLHETYGLLDGVGYMTPDRGS